MSSESHMFSDARTGAKVRRVTSHSSIHHHPFFFVPAYDGLMRRLFFISNRNGSPQLFAENRDESRIEQLTVRSDLCEWSVHPSRCRRYVYYTAGDGGWRLDPDTGREEKLVTFAPGGRRGDGPIAAAMGTTSVSENDLYWAITIRVRDRYQLLIVDIESGRSETILEASSIGHVQFCPDDSGLLFYAGELTDRVWLIQRDGSRNRRLYARAADRKQWITHESWIPGTRELAVVDWPRGMLAIRSDTGDVRQLTGFNAWHATCNRTGTSMVADTNYPDIGLQMFDPRVDNAIPHQLCESRASSVGAHWAGPFPYDKGPIEVVAPQHTHPHPSFSPDGKYVVFTSDEPGFSQVFEVEVPS